MCGCMLGTSKLPGPNKNIDTVVGGINTMNYPVDDFLGGRMGGSTSKVDGVQGGQFRVVYFLVLLFVAYFLWHYSQTH